MFGGGGLNPRKMQQMMEQMGIDMADIDATEVIIRTTDEELYFADAEVQRMEAQGQKTYQIVGDPETRELDADNAPSTDGITEDDDDLEPDDATGGGGVPDDDVELVAMRAGVDENTAREALEDAGGDLAAAVERLE